MDWISLAIFADPFPLVVVCCFLERFGAHPRADTTFVAVGASVLVRAVPDAFLVDAVPDASGDTFADSMVGALAHTAAGGIVESIAVVDAAVDTVGDIALGGTLRLVGDSLEYDPRDDVSQYTNDRIVVPLEGLCWCSLSSSSVSQHS